MNECLIACQRPMAVAEPAEDSTQDLVIVAATFYRSRNQLVTEKDQVHSVTADLDMNSPLSRPLSLP